MLEWSHGAVTKPETINCRTRLKETDFHEKIFDLLIAKSCGKYTGSALWAPFALIMELKNEVQG